jgi:HPt (histidine-containing phosphotransfer) domain-containing protein
MITSDLLAEEPEIIGLIDEFILRLPGKMEAVNETFIKQNWTEFAVQIHQIKGIGGAFGYPMLSVIAEEIECFLKEQNYTETQNLIEKLNSLSVMIVAGKDENYNIIRRNAGNTN